MKKRVILYLLIFTILACIIAVAAFPIGSLAAEDREIRKNGEVLYVHHGNGGYSGNDRVCLPVSSPGERLSMQLSMCGVPTGNGSMCPAETCLCITSVCDP